MTTAIVKAEPLRIQHLDHRDERAARLRDNFKDFMVQSFALLGQVRQDFLDKGKDETILGCSTWRAYCQNVLGYSESHVRNMLAKFGNNPASKFAPKKPHKKSIRQIADEGAERQAAIEVQQARDRGFEEGRAAEKKAQAILAATKTPVVHPNVADQTSSLADKLAFAVVYQSPQNKTTNNIHKLALDYIKLRGICEFEQSTGGSDSKKT
ncbi:MAG: hypothetical protein ABSH13_23495 [Candidatus Acidiferrum sp.]|jgi:hypothetical protein